MRSANVAAVRRALSSGLPLTIPQISGITKLSYNTIKQALPMVGAGTVEGSWPRTYEVTKETVSKELATFRELAHEGERIVVDYDDEGNWPNRFTADKRQAIANKIISASIIPNSDPAFLSELFSNLARVFASMAYDLDAVKDSPDWFEQMGGQIEE